MKQFFPKLLLFLVPVALVFAFPLLVFYIGREFTPLKEVVDLQKSATSTLLYRLGYDNNQKSYKILTTIERNPTVVAMGSSRAMQFRAEFFKNPEDFYNAAGIYNAADLVYFMEQLPANSNLKTIVLSVEPNWFTTQSPASTGPEDTTLSGLLYNFLVHGWRSAYTDFFEKKYSLQELLQEAKDNPSIGVAALTTQSGFRHDGSYAYPEALVSDDTQRLSALNTEIQGELASMTTQASVPIAISDDHIADMEKFLELCQARGIYVIGFFPPYAQEERDAIYSGSTMYDQTILSASSIAENLFKKYGYPLYDTSSLAAIGSSDKELIDDGHGSEKTYLRVLLYLAQREPALNGYINANTLKPLLATSSNVQVLSR